MVTQFILSDDDLGDFRPQAPNSLRQYLATKVHQETKPSQDRMRLIHQVAKQIRMQQIRRKTVQLARRLAILTNGDAGEAIHFCDVDSLASIKQQLAALFVIDTDQLVADLLALQRESSQRLRAARGMGE